MKYYCFVFIFLYGLNAQSQDTFSIVAADSSTREVGSAGASCVDLFSVGIADATFLGDLLPDTGAINTQAAYINANQDNARSSMRAGNNPSQIISWLISNDVAADPSTRQYGIVGFSGNTPTAAGYTGVNCMNYKNHITGSVQGIYYSMQGNILLGQQVLDSMESKFIHADGDLACRLMAALQGAKMIGADTRCGSNGTSSLFGFIKVAHPTDTYGNPSFIISVKTHSNTNLEPIDSLQHIFDLQHNCGTSGFHPLPGSIAFSIHPNPSTGLICIKMKEENKFRKRMELLVFNFLGEKIYRSYLQAGENGLDLRFAGSGMYFYTVNIDGEENYVGKFVIE